MFNTSGNKLRKNGNRGSVPINTNENAVFLLQSTILVLNYPKYPKLSNSNAKQGGRGHWAVYSTGPQSFLIRWLNNFEGYIDY